MTPTDFRSGGLGASIRFAVGECSLGSILVAASDKGVCAILLGDDARARSSRDLQDRFPRARLIGGDAELRAAAWPRWSASSRRPASGSTCRSTCAARPSSSACGRRCARFPPGSTASYTEIAERIGAPKAVRAVAHACAANAHRGGDPLPSRRAQRRQPLRLSMGRGAQACAARPRSGRVIGAIRPRPSGAHAPGIAERIAAIDWRASRRDLDADGRAVIERGAHSGRVRSAGRRSMPLDELFRSRVVMARHGFGRGEYKYFDYPLPEMVADAAHGALSAARRPSPIAGTTRWASTCAIPTSTQPISTAATQPGRPSRRRSCCGTARATTTACTRTSTASMSSRCRWRSCCRSRGGTSRAASS